jgi:DNA excision repair protein ERCC-2
MSKSCSCRDEFFKVKKTVKAATPQMMQSRESQKKEISISVRELVGYVLRSGDLSFIFRGSARTTSLAGIRAHQKIQKSRPPDYEKEVPVSYLYQTESFDLLLQGRMDGLYIQDGQIVIEEIKTTDRELDLFSDTQNDRHWGQVKTYAALYAIEHNLASVLTRLTYYQIEKSEAKSFYKEFQTEELVVFLDAIVKRYLSWIGKIEEWHAERDSLINASNFPYPSYRMGQEQMAQDVYEVIANHSHLILQAPTGVGKTVATLYPAVKALAEEYTQKIFYLTARTTGRVIAEKTLRELRSRGLRIKAVTITAKEKICFNPEKNCTPEECVFARGFYDRLDDAVEYFFSCDAFTMEVIKDAAMKHTICPFEYSLELALWADCIICDMNYAFDPRAYLKQFFLDNLTDYTFLIDEAHNLVDRSREMFSASLNKSSFLKFRRQLKNKQSDLYRLTGKINAQFLAYRKNCEDDARFHHEDIAPEDLLTLLIPFTDALERWLLANPRSQYAKAAQDLYFEIIHFFRMADQFDTNYTTYYQQKEKEFTVKLFCIDPSNQLKEAMKRAASAVLFSATMTPLTYFSQILGCDESADKKTFLSPFPPENLCVLSSNTISTFFRHRTRTTSALTRMIGSFIQARRGNYLVFFPSYEYMRMVYPLYSQAYPMHRILIQTPSMAEEDRERFLDEFSVEGDKTTVGFVVMGGIFGEAIDLDGDRLSGAAVVGVGLPGPSPERELIRAHFSDLDENGFNYAYLYPGMTRVFQAVGRVIRTESDRGAILLIDPRYDKHDYQSLFPHEWSAQRVHDTNQLRDILNRFWNNEEKA